MRLSTAAGIVAGVLALALPAGAAEVTIENLTEADIVGVSVKPGEVADFKRVRAGTSRTLEVTMPKGECQAQLVLRFDDGATSEGSADVCQGEKVRITQVAM